MCQTISKNRPALEYNILILRAKLVDFILYRNFFQYIYGIINIREFLDIEGGKQVLILPKRTTQLKPESSKRVLTPIDLGRHKPPTFDSKAGLITQNSEIAILSVIIQPAVNILRRLPSLPHTFKKMARD